MKTKNEKGERIAISFYKKITRWYAEVKEHTEAQNLMVAGADELCEVMSAGHKRVSIEMVISEKPLKLKGALVACEKTRQSNYGAYYDVKGKKDLPKEIWLCNVTKTVCGGSHPKYIYITKIEPNDLLPWRATKSSK